jgi:uncharacterized membrane protein YhhN
MRTTTLLFAVSVAASLTYLIAHPLVASDWPAIFKVLSILLLAVLAFRARSGLLVVALLASSLGDFFLGIQRLGSLNGDKLFLLGLSSFLIVHLVYIALFRQYRTLARRKINLGRWCGMLAIVIALVSVLGILGHSLGSMLIPVVVYSLVLCCMGISAMLAEMGNALSASGALLFISSDAMIAISKFGGPFPACDQLIWITYYLAQALILCGVELSPARVQRGAVNPLV